MAKAEAVINKPPMELKEISKEKMRISVLENEIEQIRLNVRAELEQRRKQSNQAISAARAEAATLAGTRMRKTRAEVEQLKKERDAAKREIEQMHQAALKELERTRLLSLRAVDQEFERHREELEKAQRIDNEPVEKACSEKEAAIAADFQVARTNLYAAREKTIQPLIDELMALKQAEAQKAVEGMTPIASGTEVLKDAATAAEPAPEAAG